MTRWQAPTWFRAPVVRLATVLCVAGMVITSAADTNTAAAQPAGTTAQPTGYTNTDHVLYWNEQLLDAFRATGGPPTTLARAGAVMHVAIYQAVHELAPTAAPYLASPPPASTPDPAQIEPAIDRAAYDTLTALFPQRSFASAYLLARGLGAPWQQPPGVPLVTAGDAVGARAAAQVLALRSDDGSGDPITYAATYAPGHWRPTGSGSGASSHWGHVRPWTMLRDDQFRPPDPGGFADINALLRSRAYADQVNETREFGRFDSPLRTADQTALARFWAEDLDGTQKPPGQLYAFTAIIARNHRLSEIDNARLFALVGMGMADATIVAWDRKYDGPYALWRPESAIHEAASAPNPAIAADPTWQPLSADATGRHFTPPFPSYTSGHSTLGGAWSAVMAGFFGTDSDTFAGTTDDPNAAGMTRIFTSYSAAGFEDAISRVFNGVHYRWDCLEGFRSGQQVGQWAVTHYLQPINASR
jgi:hypothetical protein